MFPPVRSFMIALWVSCVAGAAIVVFLSLGMFSWVTFALAGAFGVVIGVPAALWTAREVRKVDKPSQTSSQGL